jgi:hypothetical protein
MKKPAQVVMLPTNEKSKLVLSYCNELSINWTHDLAKFDDATYQQIYILSDEEIKEGDWCYGMDGIFQYKGKINLPDIELPKKIVTTTDKRLKIGGGTGKREDGISIPLPQPSQSFIEHFVAEYNRGNVITKVMVEYEMMYRDMTGEHKALMLVGTEYPKLKINSDNTINISMPKDSWSREEVIELIQKYSKECTGWSWFETDEKWIKENL